MIKRLKNFKNIKFFKIDLKKNQNWRNYSKNINLIKFIITKNSVECENPSCIINSNITIFKFN